MGKQLYQPCPSCNSWQQAQAKTCLGCGYNLNPTSNTRIILLTALATIALCSIALGSYFLGRSTRNETVTQMSPTPLPSEVTVTSPTSEQNSNIAVNSANTNIVNKPIKKIETNTNTSSREKRRAQSEGSSYGWTYVTESTDSPSGYYYYYKPSSIKVSSGSVEVWARKFPMYPSGFAKKNELSSPVDYVIEKFRFYCNDDTYYVVDETFFDAAGSSITDNRRGYRTSQSVVPGTTTETLKEQVCSELKEKL
jgi:hypothetical protein